MTLEVYRRKRDFKKTPEPPPKRVESASGRSFVVQKHRASHMHYDFRLEHNGVLWSWAIPKGPSLDPADKRLAMQTEDHPVEYGGFEGIIPAGEYGGGTVMVWDRGTWTPVGDPAAGYAKGNLKFTLDGEKLHGGFALVRTRTDKYGKQSWLLIKEKDDAARPGYAVVEEAPDSVLSGRDLDAIASARAHVWRSKLSVKENVKAGAVAPMPAPKAVKKRGAKGKAGAAAAEVEAAPRGRKAAMPATMTPMLATLVDKAPPGDDWVHEVKYDGYRFLVRIEKKRAQLISRNGKEWTASFPGIVDELAALPVKQAWLDGELVVLDDEGRSTFQGLQNALSGGRGRNLAFFVFDLLYRDGHDLRGLPLTARKAALREVVGEGTKVVKMGPEVRAGGPDFFRQACELKLEGIIAKRADATYQSGARTRDWLKVKCVQRQEMVIAGYTDPQGSRTGFGALLLGVYDGKDLKYAGKVGTGFDDKALRDLMPKLTEREQEKPAFVNPPRGYAAKGAHWIRPELVAEVAFTEWSDDGALRHPSFQGLRMDKKASEVVREKPMATAKAAAAAPASKARTAGKRAAAGGRADASEVAGVKLSHPEKMYWPEASITKGDLAAYYAAVADWIVPHLAGRPLSLVRCPDGWSGQCFYQKHAAKAVNAAVKRVEAPESRGMATYLSADSAAGLAGLVQWGVIELHPWGSRTPRLDRPDRLIFDFDPDDDLDYADLVAAVQLLRTLLGEIGLTGFLKTTGGKGLHVVLPIRATLTWDDAKAFTKSVADFLVRTFPDRFTATLSKERRKGKIFIDFLRNAEGATAIAPYAVRARKNAPVAMPIFWEELERDLRFDHFNVRNAQERLATQKRDPWREFSDTKQTITAAMRKRFR